MKASVAEAALNAGANWLNDISGGRSDPGMLPLAARTGAPIILMHNRLEPRYTNLVPEVIADLQRVVLDGGQVAVAFPRGGGKTTLAECAALWAVLYGHRRFVMLIGATEGKAGELLDSVKAEVETNDRLAADFPEACHPVRMLEGINNRASGQTLGGERTRIEWTNKAVCLPTVPGAACSGAVVQVAGITGSTLRSGSCTAASWFPPTARTSPTRPCRPP